MKKILEFFLPFIVLLLMSIPTIAQDRTITGTMANETYWKYTGIAALDTLTPNQDTIDVVIQYRNHNYVKKIALKTKFDTIGGADTTVSVSVFGKEFADDATYVQIIGATLSSAVTTDDIVQVLTSDYYETADTSAVGTIKTLTPFDKSYRYYRIRYIISGNDHVGVGIKLDEIELKTYY